MGVHLLYRALIAPRAAEEDTRRREWILNTLLTISILLSGGLTISAVFQWLTMPTYQGAPIWAIGGVCATFVALLIASRRGAMRPASFILLGMYALPVGYTAYRWGTDLPYVLIAYALVITMASVLISTRTSLVVTALIGLYVMGLSFLQTRGIVQPLRYWYELPFSLADAGVGVALMVAVALVAWISNREIDRSLTRARTSERDLLRERDLLEERVEERTREVKRLQMEQLSQQYRFIEFGRLSSGFFHDLITPLNVVSLHLERLKNTPGGCVEEATAHVEHALGTAKHVETFLQDIRRHLRHQELKESFSFSEEIQRAVRMLTHKAKKAGVDFILDVPEIPPIHTNPTKCNQLLVNILSNAIDAYADISQTTGCPRAIHLMLSEEHGEITLVARDWGCGVAAEHRPRMFEAFFTTKGPEKGTGIGLTIVKDIVENTLGGQVTVEHPHDGGVQFVIRFPRPLPPCDRS
ncbi:MAG: hypothetical protein RL141_159 [Candidatus Parcubacteria bacterium]|jgi:signal transduction histidine kinase